MIKEYLSGSRRLPYKFQADTCVRSGFGSGAVLGFKPATGQINLADGASPHEGLIVLSYFPAN